MGARPQTLPAAVAPVVIGWACAAALDGFRLGPAIAALLGAVFLQIGANYANDLGDYRRGADNADRLGPPRALQSGALSEHHVWAATWISFALAMLAGLYLLWIAGPAVVAIGVASIAAAVLYTGGPYPLGYLGLGEVFVFAFFGPVAVLGTVWVQVGELAPLAIWASIMPGLLAVAILIVNNLRDIPTDREAGKRTLAVRFGARATRFEYLFVVASAFLLTFLPMLVRSDPELRAVGGWALLPWVLVPLAGTRVRQVWGREGRELNRTLAGTARLMLWFCLLLAVGIRLGS